jgi:hypothetical protein
VLSPSSRQPLLSFCCCENKFSYTKDLFGNPQREQQVPTILIMYRTRGVGVLITELISMVFHVTGRRGPLGCETSRLQHSLDNRLTGDGEVVSLTRRPPFTPQEDSWYSFLLEAESTPQPLCGWKD